MAYVLDVHIMYCKALNFCIINFVDGKETYCNNFDNKNVLDKERKDEDRQVYFMNFNSSASSDDSHALQLNIVFAVSRLHKNTVC